MAEPGKPPAEVAADRVVAPTRVLAAPRDAVLRAFSDPARLAQWWGPNGFTNTIEEFDFRPGGAFRLTMQGPDGTNYPNRWVCREITPGRLVLDHVDNVHAFELAITLAAQGDRTHLTWQMTFATAAECGRVRALVTPANEESLDRLAALLASLLSTQST
jgi:uncharacterized protein YndB with AHSA1/START domain